MESGQIREPGYRIVIRLCRALNVDPERVAEFALGDAGAATPEPPAASPRDERTPGRGGGRGAF